MNYEEVRQMLEKALDERDNFKKITVVINGESKRVGRYNESNKNSEPFIFAKGRKRWGNTLSDYISKHGEIITLSVKKESRQAEKWKKSWQKVATRLEKSGLWNNLLERTITGLEIGEEKIKKAYELYWQDHFLPNGEKMSYEERNKLNAKMIGEVDIKLLTKEGHPNTDIIWYMSRPAKIKKMNFGKYATTEKLMEIACALTEKRKFSTFGRTSYDVSYSYNPEVNKAWYSEEFKNCGNGHYYLALDATHALFYEDD